FRLRAHEAIERTAVAEGIDRRQRLHAKLPRDARVLVHVDFDEPHLAGVAADNLLTDRRQLLAWATPGRPEIDDHRHGARCFEHVLGETRRRRILDDVGIAPASGRSLQSDFHASSPRGEPVSLAPAANSIAKTPLAPQI